MMKSVLSHRPVSRGWSKVFLVLFLLFTAAFLFGSCRKEGGITPVMPSDTQSTAPEEDTALPGEDDGAETPSGEEEADVPEDADAPADTDLPLAGDILRFGHYEQDNDAANGPEPIEWRVLGVNAQERWVTMIACDLLDVRPYLGKKCGDEVIDSDGKFAELLLKKNFVAVIPGAPFGANGFVRLSYAVSDIQISEAVRRIKNFVTNLE